MSEICMTLIPYDKREGIPLNIAAERAGKSPGTIRNWCIEHGIGRRVGSGQWIVSKLRWRCFWMTMMWRFAVTRPATGLVTMSLFILREWGLST